MNAKATSPLPLRSRNSNPSLLRLLRRQIWLRWLQLGVILLGSLCPPFYSFTSAVYVPDSSDPLVVV
jgi:hypothetical protein